MNYKAVCWLLVAVGLSGCESLSEVASGLRENFEVRNEGRTKVFAASSRETYEAVRLAAVKMGYRILRGGAAQGRIEAVSEVRQGESQFPAARDESKNLRVGSGWRHGGEHRAYRNH